MNLKKVGTEILNDGFVVVRAVTEGCNAAESELDSEKELDV